MSKTDRLVEKFWKGETTEQEEKLLKSIADQDSFKSNYPDLSDYFLAIREVEDLKLDSETRKNILKSTKQSGAQSKVIWAYAVAASFALLLAVILSPSRSEYSDEEIQLAYQQTKATLLMVSDKMNEGTGYAQNLAHFDKSQQMVQNQIRINSKTK